MPATHSCLPMLRHSVFVAALFLSGLGLATAAEVTLTEEKSADGQSLLRVRHPSYTLEILPAQGGAVKLAESAAGALTAPDKATVSLLRECFREADMGTVLPAIAYTVTSAPEANGGLRVALEATLTEAQAGPDLDGVTLTRTLRFDPALPRLDVELALTNTTAALRYAAIGIQNRFRLHKHGEDYAFLPTTRNVLSISKSLSIFGYYGKESPWEYEPVEGWLAVNDPEGKHGLAFAMDYNVLESFFTDGNAATYGWFLDGGELPPKATFRTRYCLIPIAGFAGFAYVSPNLLADISVRPLGTDRTSIQQTIAAVTPIGKTTVEASVLGVRSGSRTALGVQTLAKIEAQPVTCPGVLPKTQDEPLVVKVRIETGENKVDYETMYEGAFHARPIPALPLAVEYRRPAPRRAAPAIEGGDASNVARPAKGRRALVFFGLYSQFYQIDKALAGWELKASDARPKRAAYLPPASQIGGYALIVLSDVTAESLPAAVIRRIERYVSRGGSLLVLGGPFAYGEGRYDTMGLDALLPVTSAPFDLQWEKNGLPFCVAREHAITRDLDLSAGPRVFWLHRVKAKESGQVLLAAGDYDVLLAVQSYGSGRVAAFTGTPLGEPNKDQVPFWTWNGWTPLLKRTAEWLYE